MPEYVFAQCGISIYKEGVSYAIQGQVSALGFDPSSTADWKLLNMSALSRQL